MDYVTLMAINATASLNAELNRFGFKAVIFDADENEIWFFVDEIGKTKVNGLCQAVWKKESDKFFFGTMDGDWEDLGSDPEKACAVFRRAKETACQLNAVRETGKDKTTYHLDELPSIHIDAWVNGISNMCDIDHVRHEAYEMAGLTENDEDPVCPAEMEHEYNALAEKYAFRFDGDGKIVSYCLI